MTDPLRLLDLAGDLIRTRRGDTEARGRLMRRALPLAADALIRPGAGRLLERGLETLRDVASDEGWQLPELVSQASGGQALPNYEPFVQRLVEAPFGFYSIAGEPGTGKTTLALRLAQRIAEEQGFRVVAVGGMHPDDRRRWSADEWVEPEPAGAFLRAMDAVSEAMLDRRARHHAREITQRVILLDDAILLAHISAKRFGQALVQAWTVYRHLDWVIVVTTRQFRALVTIAEAADARFLKRPDWQQLATERDKARGWWREADQAYRQLRRSADWQERPKEREWVYAQAPRFGYVGMLPYGPPSPPTVPTSAVVVEPPQAEPGQAAANELDGGDEDELDGGGEAL